MLKTYEITGKGFDGSTDATDDRVLWVLADCEKDVKAAIANTGANFHGELCNWSNSGIDYILPQDHEKLVDRLLSFC